MKDTLTTREKFQLWVDRKIAETEAYAETHEDEIDYCRTEIGTLKMIRDETLEPMKRIAFSYLKKSYDAGNRGFEESALKYSQIYSTIELAILQWREFERS